MHCCPMGSSLPSQVTAELLTEHSVSLPEVLFYPPGNFHISSGKKEMNVPAAETIKTQCLSCDSTLRVKSGLIGKKVKCPKCEQPFIVTEIKDNGVVPENTSAFNADSQQTSDQLNANNLGNRRIPSDYHFNSFHKAAFFSWGVGALLVVIPVASLLISGADMPSSRIPVLITFLALGIVLLAVGGTCHKIGSNRDRRD